MKAIHSFFDFMVSKRLTLILMGVSAVVMAVITVFEAMEGGEQTPFRYYYSPWFLALLVLVWLNLFANMLKLRWWKLSRLPLSLSHLGFLLILTGGFFTWTMGLRGNLSIMEGESWDTFRVEQPVLLVQSLDQALPRVAAYFIGEDGRLRSGGLIDALNPFVAKKEVELADGRPLALLETMASSRIQLDVKEAHAGEGPPALVLEVGDDRPERIVIQDGEALSLDRAAGARLLYQHRSEEGWSPADLLNLFNESIEIKPVEGASVKIPVTTPGDVGKEFTQGDYTVKLLEYYPNFKMGVAPDPDDPPHNPALHLQVTGPHGTKTLYSFALLEFHGNRLADGTQVLYHRPGAACTVLLVSRDSGAIEAYTGSETPAQVLEHDAPFHFHAAGSPLVLSLKAHWPGSITEERTVWDPSGRGPPAYKVRIGNNSAPVWIRADQEEGVVLNGNARVIVGNQYPLGFALSLDDAVAEYWPSSRIPKAFYSMVKVLSGGATSPVEARIETNDPLFQNGFRLYQSSMDTQAPYRFSIFAVSKDPGVGLVTAGFLIMMASMLWLYVQRYLLKPLRVKKEAA